MEELETIAGEFRRWQRSTLFTNDDSDNLYQKLAPYFSEIVRRAREKHQLSEAQDIKSYLYGLLDSVPTVTNTVLSHHFIESFVDSLFRTRATGELSWEKLKEEANKEILSILSSQRQPGAGELLEILEKKFGWRVRHILAALIGQLRSDSSLQSYLRDYLKTTLSDESIKNALLGNAKPDREFKGTLDDLLQQSHMYRRSGAFQEMIEFTAKFRDYAPYNNLLVRIQNPSCSFYATARDWRERFDRQIKEDAKPMLILAPMHPVMLVYDLDSTEGKPLPENLLTFGKTEGDWDPKYLENTLENAVRDRILVQFKELSSTHGGFVTSEAPREDHKMRIVVNKEFDDKSRYATLCHELAHIYLGHLGADKDKWWPCRINLTDSVVEIEAEAVSYIVGVRLGLKPPSAAYLSHHVEDDPVWDRISVELIVKVAGKLLEMGERKMPPRKPAKKAATEKNVEEE